MNINFIIPVPNSSYGNVIRGIIDPVLKFLPECVVTQKTLADHINIHFFTEAGYQRMVGFEKEKGIHFFIDHGLSDKCYREARRVQIYDYIGVSGPLWLKKMLREGLAENRIKIIGYPKLDPIFQGGIPKNRKIARKVLWAPTHSNSISSYPGFEPYISQFPKEYTVISSVHPFDKPDLLPTFHELVEADVVISDTSSTIYEAWALGKPVIFPDWLVKAEVAKHYPSSFEDIIYKNKIGYHANSFDELIGLLPKAIIDGLDRTVIQFMEGILPSALRGKSGEETAKILLDLQKSL